MIRYQRGRFRGAAQSRPGSPRYELGLQLKQDVVHRLVDVWATGEASASLGFEAARVFDELDPLEKQKDRILARTRHHGGMAALKALRQYQKLAIELLALESRPSGGATSPVRGTEAIRWCSTPCSTPSPTCSAPPASCGTPATART